MGIFTKAVAWFTGNMGLTDPRLYAYLGPGETDSGETVSGDGALQIATVWACVRLIAQTIATLPCHVYRTDRRGYGSLAKDHPLYRLLHDRPNADMTAVEFWEAIVGALLLWGNAYVAITRFGARIVALTPMRPDMVQCRIEKDGTKTYVYTVNGQTQTLRESDVLHIKGFSLDGQMGISPIAAARNSLGAARAAERASAAVFKNEMRPSGLAKSPNFLTPAQREDAQVMLASFKGAANRGKVPLMEGGWDFVPLTMPPNDAQLLETQNFHVKVLCRLFEVPPIMIGHSDDSSALGSSTEKVMEHFYKTCIRHHLERLEQAVNGKLLTPDDQRAGIYVEFVAEGLLRADSAARASYYSTMVQNGIMTRNEARSLENMAPMDGGDDITVQSNLVLAKLLEEIGVLVSRRQISPQNGSSTPIPEIKQ